MIVEDGLRVRVHQGDLKEEEEVVGNQTTVEEMFPADKGAF